MEQQRTNLRRSGRWPWIVAAVALVAAVGYGAWRLWPREPPPEPPPVAAAPAPEVGPVAPAAPAPDESPVDAAGARPVLEKISSNVLVRAWLAEGNPIRRLVVLLANLSEGAVPRKILGAFAPGSPFSVERRGGTTVIAPESYARYHAVGDAVDTMDAKACASAYRRLRGVLEPALTELGYPPGSLDRLTLRALKRIEDAPVADGDVAVRQEDGMWLFADARLEKLGDLDKQLLRLGPRNERRVQAKARELRDALKLPAVAAGGR